MSELKSHRILGMNEECARVENDYYLKSDADKVIAGLEKQIEFLKTTHDSCGNCSKCADGMGKVFDENLDGLKAKIAQLEADNALLRKNDEEHRKENESLKYQLGKNVADAKYIEKLEKELAELREAFRWRKTADEQPEIGERVVCFMPKGDPDISIMRLGPDDPEDGGSQWLEDDDEDDVVGFLREAVTYWMPRPKAPEDGK